jgi:transcriptional regulator with XRE-family HTH domain
MLHERIKEERGKKGLSQKELGDLFGITQQAVGSWETGKSVPDSITLAKLADYFNVTADYLLGREVVTADHADPDIAKLLKDNGIKKLKLMAGYTLEDVRKLVEAGNIFLNRKTGG